MLGMQNTWKQYWKAGLGTDAMRVVEQLAAIDPDLYHFVVNNDFAVFVTIQRYAAKTPTRWSLSLAKVMRAVLFLVQALVQIPSFTNI